jgi:hypothetical protein
MGMVSMGQDRRSVFDLKIVKEDHERLRPRFKVIANLSSSHERIRNHLAAHVTMLTSRNLSSA